MATKKRGQTIKKDVAGQGFLNFIPTANVLLPKYHPVFYRILFDMKFADLECDRQILAWQIALTTCRLYQALDCSSVFNEADKAAFDRAQDLIPKLQKSLLDLINAFRRSSRSEESESEDKQMDVRDLLRQLDNDRHCEVRREPPTNNVSG